MPFSSFGERLLVMTWVHISLFIGSSFKQGHVKNSYLMVGQWPNEASCWNIIAVHRGKVCDSRCERLHATSGLTMAVRGLVVNGPWRFNYPYPQRPTLQGKHDRACISIDSLVQLEIGLFYYFEDHIFQSFYFSVFIQVCVYEIVIQALLYFNNVVI